MRHNSETFVKFKMWRAEVENQTGRKSKCLRSYNDPKYTNSRFIELCENYGIMRHFTVKRNPQ